MLAIQIILGLWFGALGAPVMRFLGRRLLRRWLGRLPERLAEDGVEMLLAEAAAVDVRPPDGGKRLHLSCHTEEGQTLVDGRRWLWDGPEVN